MARIAERRATLNRELDNLNTLARENPGRYALHGALLENLLAAASNELPAEELAGLKAAAERDVAGNAVAGLIERDPALAIQGLKEGVFDDDLPAAERKRLRARAGAAQRDRRAQAERGQARHRAAAGADGARRLVALEGAIERGEAGEQAIAEAADILDEPTRARLHEKLDTRRAEDAARDRP
ncbi:MAG: hypothetical protein V3S59_02090 [Alphaproteobacteria bacterium]